MSHFSVMVLGNDIEGQLAPFQENNMGDCPKKYLAFRDQEDEFREEYQTATVTRVVMPDGRLLPTWDDTFRTPGSFGIGGGSHKVPAHLAQREVPFKKLYQSLELFAQDYHGHEARDAETGRFGYWENPNKKWDWFSLGGRWSGFLWLKDGAAGLLGERSWTNKDKPVDERAVADQCRRDAIDVEGMRQAAEIDAGKQWDEAHAVIQGRTFTVWRDVLSHYGKDDIAAARDEYHAQPIIKEWIKKFGSFHEIETFISTTRERFLNSARRSACSTFAVLKDGQWYERGEMGWFGISMNEKRPGEWQGEFDQLFDELPGDTLVSIVDCHI